KITIAQDLGQTLEIESGVEPSDRVIINPSDSIEDGDHVVVTRPQSQPQAKNKAAS
ncbi:MAG: efflux transporter periplasmic adaptor subunit, partial [Paraburkholderia hospita]